MDDLWSAGYIVWVNCGSENWVPHMYKDLKSLKESLMSVAFASRFIITKPCGMHIYP